LSRFSAVLLCLHGRFADPIAQMITGAIKSDAQCVKQNARSGSKRAFKTTVPFKDDYEVARLHRNGQFAEKIKGQFEDRVW
jgi:hypothetical protein